MYAGPHTRWYLGYIKIVSGVTRHPDDGKYLEGIAFHPYLSQGHTTNHDGRYRALYQVTMSTWGSGMDIYSIIIAISGTENAIQSVISPCRGNSLITSAASLCRTFHDLLMSRLCKCHHPPLTQCSGSCDAYESVAIEGFNDPTKGPADSEKPLYLLYAGSFVLPKRHVH